MNSLQKFFQNDRNIHLFLLFAILLHNLIYPLSTGRRWEALIFYVVLSSMFVITVFLLSSSMTQRLIILISGLCVFITGMVNVYSPGNTILTGLYISVIVYHLMMIYVLVIYIFESKHILLEVVIAATSLYLVFGSMYTAFYGIVEVIEPGSFYVASGAELDWQRLVYYSYVTLTTLGYGDITPVKFYAQSLSTFEAVTGVLYTVILLARLVGLWEMSLHDE